MTKLEIEDATSTFLYFGYTCIMVYLFFVLTGKIFLRSLNMSLTIYSFLNDKLYNCIKQDRLVSLPVSGSCGKSTVS